MHTNAYTSTGPAAERAAAHREDRHTLFISSKQETAQGLGPAATREVTTMAQNTATNEKYIGEGVGFERIRRITGYLVGTMDHWNNAKRAEEHDRVKHDVQMQKL